MAACFIFAILVVFNWEPIVGIHEELYFLGSRRLADPSLLAVDFTWSKLPPSTWLFDHLLAPLWSFWNADTIANVGRVTFWSLLAASLAFLARTVRLPAWAAPAGVLVWLAWGQTFGLCGSPLEGFQPKSLAYPLIFFALSFAIRGWVVWAGLIAGLATALHIVVGGWSLMALFLSLLVNRRLFTLRQVAVLLFASAPFVVPIVLAFLGHGEHISSADQSRADEIYVMFAMPHCCDVFFFLSSKAMALGWFRAIVVCAIAPIVVFAWPERRTARILGTYTVALIAFFALGVVGGILNLHGFLKVYPFQLAKALPVLFLFMFTAGWLGIGGAMRRMGPIVWPLIVVAMLWMMIDRQVPIEMWDRAQFFLDDVRARPALVGENERPVYGWIRRNTPRNSVFITPLLSEFWPYAQRAQVASMRQPPLDVRLIEWKDRLEALNGFRPYAKRGWAIAQEITQHEAQLSVEDVIKIRDRYGATFYMLKGERPDLAPYLLHSESGYSIYDITRLTSAGIAR